MGSISITFNWDNFSYITALFLTLNFILMFATSFALVVLGRHFRKVTGFGIKEIYILLLIPMLLNIFNLLVSEGVVNPTASLTLLVSVGCGLLIIGAGVLMLRKLLKHLEINNLKD